jgi:fluoride exporter
MNAWLAVFVGGGLGSVARFAVGLGAARWTRSEWPWGTLLANVLATVLLMWLLVRFQSSMDRADKAWVLLLTTGFCGGFSTFSTFSADTLRLAELSGWGWAVTNVAVNVVACLAFGALIYWSAKGRI